MQDVEGAHGDREAQVVTLVPGLVDTVLQPLQAGRMREGPRRVHKTAA